VMHCGIHGQGKYAYQYSKFMLIMQDLSVTIYRKNIQKVLFINCRGVKQYTTRHIHSNTPNPLENSHHHKRRLS
ncbi:MAG: hypothetical protein OIF50_15255, partial [Flavobacteriaceae bacterium]|nr:hypothetical protein [Flavobacteriaceae bacterium]